jgi:hypothetical protein
MSKPYQHAPWIYKGNTLTTVPDNCIAFVYLLTEVATGKQYIGKKGFWSVSTVVVNGRKKNTKRESEWAKYYSSNNEIMATVKGGNGAKFTREILHLCKTKGTASYLEAKEIFSRGCLEDPVNWFNYFLEIKVNAGHLKF